MLAAMPPLRYEYILIYGKGDPVARPRSDEKRADILAAAGRVIGDFGPSAPTARIAKEAGVAEGTIFIYFDTKDELLNELYLELKETGEAAARRPRYLEA
jgi:AcrR family transcriptional regulator